MSPITRVLFLGQSCAAAMPPLTALIEAGFVIPAVVLARQAGMRLGEIQRVATAMGIPVVWVTSAAEATETIRSLAPEVAVAACFPWRLPRAARETPPLGILNIHPSLLPAGRGAEPVFWTLRRGERITGVTVHRMDAGFDTGPIVAQAERLVPDGIAAPELERDLMTLGGSLLVDALPALAAGTLQPRPQPSFGYQPGPRAGTRRLDDDVLAASGLGMALRARGGPARRAADGDRGRHGDPGRRRARLVARRAASGGGAGRRRRNGAGALFAGLGALPAHREACVILNAVKDLGATPQLFADAEILRLRSRNNTFSMSVHSAGDGWFDDELTPRRRISDFGP